MVKKNRIKAAPFLARSREDDIKRRAVVEEVDANWKCLESKKPESSMGAIEEAFISYSPMSDIVQEEQDDTSVDEILPFEEMMSDSGRFSEDGTIANSVGHVGKPAGNNIESNRSGSNPSTEEATEVKSKTTNAARISETSGPSTRSSGVSSSSTERNPISGLSTSATEMKATRTKTPAFTQEDFEILEDLRQIPFGRLTGRQQEELHGVFYRKHSERNTRYMNTWETAIHVYFESTAMNSHPREGTYTSDYGTAREEHNTRIGGRLFLRRIYPNPSTPTAIRGGYRDSGTHPICGR